MRVHVGLAILLALLGHGCSCSDDKDPPPVDGGDDDAAVEAGVDGGVDAEVDADTLDMFEAWREQRQALRTSPDHLPARAAELVADADPEAIFAFVRDQIATYPSRTDGFDGTPYATRWGTRGTLRGGAGTPREKADLLAELLTDAGFEAHVVHGVPDPTRVDGHKLLLRATERTFAPEIDAERAELWSEAQGFDATHPPPQRTAVALDGARVTSLTSDLLDALPTDLETTFDFTLDQIPLVAFERDGETVYANPLVADAELGESLTMDTPVPTGDSYPVQRVRVRLSAARANDPYDRFTLVEREYDADQVVGRRVHLAFRPPVPTVQMLRSRADQFDTFLPILTVNAPDLPAAEGDELAAIGDAVSMGGDVFHLDGAGELTVNGAVLAQGVSDASEIARVTDVEVRAEAAAYPQVTLRVRALDADGEGVDHLASSAFTVTDEGEPVTFTVTRNEAPPPRIAVLFDISTSVPMEFLGAGTVAVAEDIAAGLYAARADANVRFGVLSFGAQWMGPWVSSLGDAEAQAQDLETATGGSEIWAALSDASEEEPTLVILVTDGDPSEELLEEQRAAIAAGPPVLTLGVGTAMQATLDTISALSGGSDALAADASSAITQALAAIEDSLHDNYTLSYHATDGATATHDVSVTINDVSAQTTYQVPEMPVTPPALSGLYLTIISEGREHTRALAGFDRGYTTAHQPVSQAMLDDVKAMLRGRVSIAIEGAAPSPSVLLDDWISERLQMETLHRAVEEGDQAAILEAVEEGFILTPSRLPLAHPPLPPATEDALTFEASVRIATLVQKTYEDGPITHSLDVFPFTQWVTASDDARAAFSRTVSAGAALAVTEAELFTGTSTLEALNGETLTLVAPGQARNQAGLTDEEQLQWAALEDPYGPNYALLVPLQPGPFWAIDRTTGTVIGVLADGSGGGGGDICDTHDQLNNMLELLGLLGDFFDVGAIGPWVALAMWEVKYVTIATIVIGGGALGSDNDLTNPAGDMACDIADGIIGDHIPGYGTLSDVIDVLNNHGGGTGVSTLCGGDGSGGPC